MGSGADGMNPLPASLRARHRPPIAKRVPANDHRRRWAGHGHVGTFLLQLGCLILVNLAVWGLIAWSAMQYAGHRIPPPTTLTGPL